MRDLTGWQWYLLMMLRQTVKTQEIKRLVNTCYTRYREGFVTHIQKGDVPSRYQSMATYLATYMVQHVCPQGFQRVWYYRVQATKTFAKIKRMIHDALATVKGGVEGAIQIIASKVYRQRYQPSTGRDPLRCPHGQSTIDVWRIWHPVYGVIYDELEAIRRGQYASQASRADPAERAGRTLWPTARGISLSLFGLLQTAVSFASFFSPSPVESM